MQATPLIRLQSHATESVWWYRVTSLMLFFGGFPFVVLSLIMFEVKIWGGLVIYLQFAICAYNFSLLVALLSAWNMVLKTVLCLQWNLIWLYECVPLLDTILCSCQFDLRNKRRENMWLINQVFICPPMLEPLFATTVVWLNLQSQPRQTNWFCFVFGKKTFEFWK